MQAKYKTLSVVTVATAGTRVPLSSTPLYASALLIVADRLNSGYVYIGDESVSSANGIELSAGRDHPIGVESEGGRFNAPLNLADIYIDSSVNGNAVRVSYIGKR
jgi:hypothetical protein